MIVSFETRLSRVFKASVISFLWSSSVSGKLYPITKTSSALLMASISAQRTCGMMGNLAGDGGAMSISTRLELGPSSGKLTALNGSVGQ